MRHARHSINSVQEWVSLHEERGLSYGKIAGSFGVTRATVAGVIQRAKRPPKPPRPPMPPKTHFRCGHAAIPENTYGPYGNLRGTYCRICKLKAQVKLDALLARTKRKAIKP